MPRCDGCREGRDVSQLCSSPELFVTRRSTRTHADLLCPRISYLYPSSLCREEEWREDKRTPVGNESKSAEEPGVVALIPSDFVLGAPPQQAQACHHYTLRARLPRC